LMLSPKALGTAWINIQSGFQKTSGWSPKGCGYASAAGLALSAGDAKDEFAET